MIKTGIDVVEISRFENMKNPDEFLKRVFTDREAEYFSKKKNKWESIAGFYAAKEAFSKFLGTGVRDFSLKDIEIAHNELGKPYILFKGGKIDADLSISHSDTVATAIVCGGVIEAYPEIENIEFYRELLPKRFPDMNKGDCGRVFIIAGSSGMTGAAELCAMGALRSGSGLVTVATPKSQQPILATKLTEAMTMALAERDGMISYDAKEQIIDKVIKNDVSVIGPGLGNSPDLWRIIDEIVKIKRPLVIDADGLNAISSHIDIFDGEKKELVITPHPGEMSRLCGLPIIEIQKNRDEIAKEYAKRWGVTLLLKGKGTIIAGPDGRIHINPTGNSGMATGGMGDVLSGMIGSFMGQGLDGYDAAVLAAFLHGYAGDIAKEEIGEFGMLAGDVVRLIPKSISITEG